MPQPVAVPPDVHDVRGCSSRSSIAAAITSSPRTCPHSLTPCSRSKPSSTARTDRRPAGRTASPSAASPAGSPPRPPPALFRGDGFRVAAVGEGGVGDFGEEVLFHLELADDRLNPLDDAFGSAQGPAFAAGGLGDGFQFLLGAAEQVFAFPAAFGFEAGVEADRQAFSGEEVGGDLGQVASVPRAGVCWLCFRIEGCNSKRRTGRRQQVPARCRPENSDQAMIVSSPDSNTRFVCPLTLARL